MPWPWPGGWRKRSLPSALSAFSSTWGSPAASGSGRWSRAPAATWDGSSSKPTWAGGAACSPPLCPRQSSTIGIVASGLLVGATFTELIGGSDLFHALNREDVARYVHAREVFAG